MSYAIMRIQKIKSYQALAEREKHNTRCKTVLSADGTNNIDICGKRGLVGHVKKLEKEINSINKRKTRKDAIRTIEVLFTSDKAFFKRVYYNQYFDRCKEWLIDTFGADNILQTVIHKDEEVEHLHCILTTIKEGKFNYSGYINGREDLRKLQDSFYKKVSDFDLKRGERVELTGNTYKSNREWNKNVSQARSYAQALNEEQRLDYAVQGVLFKDENQKNHEKLNEYSKENKRLKNEYKELKDNFNALISINKKVLKINDDDKDLFLQKAISNERKVMQFERNKSHSIDELSI